MEGSDGKAYLLTELLVNRIARILNRYTPQIPCGNLKTQWEMQIDLLDRWGGEEFLKVLLLLNRCWRLVDLPAHLLASIQSPISMPCHTP